MLNIPPTKEEAMRKAMVAAAVLFIIIFFSSPAFAVESQIVDELFKDMLFPIYNSRNIDGYCIGFWYKPLSFDIFNEIERSLFLSAGHCRHLRFVQKSEMSLVEPEVQLILKVPDLLIGSMFDYRIKPKYFKRLERNLVTGEIVYAIAKPLRWGEKISVQTLKFKYQDGNTLIFEAAVPAQGGISGGPVVTATGELVGIFVQYEEANSRTIYVTIIDVVEKAETMLNLLTREEHNSKTNTDREEKPR